MLVYFYSHNVLMLMDEFRSFLVFKNYKERNE